MPPLEVPVKLTPFSMERWQSTYEHRVELNLSESGVHPMTVGELAALAGVDPGLEDIRLGYGQSNGSDLLRGRIASMYRDADDACVVVTTGGAEANFTACWHLMEPGARAATIVPNYMQVPGILESFGAVPHPVPLDESTGWQPDLGALRAALDAGCRFVLVTNPNNPTGARLTDESMNAIVSEAERVGAWILADEVYQGAELGEEETPSFWGRYDRLLVTNSLSKAYGLPGVRLGWVVGPPPVVQDIWARTDYTTIAPATLSDALAVIALEPDTRARIRARTRRILNENVDLIRDWMDAHGGLFRYRLPDAGAICYPRYAADVNSSAFAEKLRVEKSVLLVPGDQFGMDRYLRIGFGNPAGELEEALGRIAEAFREIGVPVG